MALVSNASAVKLFLKNTNAKKRTKEKIKKKKNKPSPMFYTFDFPGFWKG